MNFSRLKAYLDRIVNEYNVPGVDCIVYKEHNEIFRYFTGKSDIENNTDINGNELYLIFSMTKMITCTAALQLYEQGKFLMSDPLAMYLPEFKNMKISSEVYGGLNGRNITTGASFGEKTNDSVSGFATNPILIRDLFTMSAGFDYDLNADGIKKALNAGKKSTREIVSAMAETVLGFEPGTRFRYSLCHDVLGALIEVISGKKLGVYMRENIFEPLGMKNTFFGLPESAEKLSEYTVRYTFDENRNPKRLPLECVYNLSDEYESGGAGLTSCTEDYAIFTDALANGGVGKTGIKILSKASVELMATNHMVDGEQMEDFQELRKGYGYGLGVRTHVDKAKSGSLSPIGEFGWDGAAGAFSMVDPVNHLSMAYFQHIHNWDIRVQNELRNILYSCID